MTEVTHEIVVVGRRYTVSTGSSGAVGGGGGQNFGESSASLTPELEGGGGEPYPPRMTCRDAATMTPEELIDYRISQEASRVAAEIMATPDKDVREYASLIYIDDNGIVRHTPIQAGQTTSSSASTVGTRDYGQVVALVHSHTAAVF